MNPRTEKPVDETSTTGARSTVVTHKQPMSKGLVVAVVALVGICLVLFFIGIVPRIQRSAELKQMHETTVGAVPVLHTVVAAAAPESEQIVLPANIAPIQYASIYARVDGYLKSRLVDIGDRVKTGQLLAVIDTPELDQQLNQAKADLAESVASLANARAQLKEAIAENATAIADVSKATTNLTYASTTNQRWQNLASRGAVSLQSRDEKYKSFEAASADVDAAKANQKATESKITAAESQVSVAKANILAKAAAVKKYESQVSFQRVTAPFDGVIMFRQVDPGALITAGSGNSQLELYKLAKIDTLRVYVNVPQRFARYLKAGQKADVTVPEYPGQHFMGLVSNVARGLDPATRTMQTEIQIPNQVHALYPGMYASIDLTGLREDPWIRIPGTGLIVRSKGLFVGLVKNGKFHYQPVTVGRDFGDAIEIKTGLQDGDLVAISPPDLLREGEEVQSIAIPDKDKNDQP
jgi:RND family efflux transporter MFP subunit